MEVRYEWANEGLVRCRVGRVDAGVSGEKEVGGISKPSCELRIEDSECARRRRMKEVTVIVRVGGFA